MPSNQNKTRESGRDKSSYSSGSSSRKSGSSNLSGAAEKMRSGNPEERSEAASELGRAGGKQSHKND